MVLLPALQLSRADLRSGEITRQQQLELRSTIVRVVEGLDGGSRVRLFQRQQSSVLEDASPGRLLRQKRLLRQRGEAANPTRAPHAHVVQGSMVLCLGLGSLGDDLAAELLVRILREMHIDARHLTLEDLQAPRPRDVEPSTIAAMCLVSVTPGEERRRGVQLGQEIRAKLPHAFMLALLLPSVLGETDDSTLGESVDRLATSFEEAALEVSERIGNVVTSPPPATGEGAALAAIAAPETSDSTSDSASA